MKSFDYILFCILFGLNCGHLFYYSIERNVWRFMFWLLAFCTTVYFPIFSWYYAAADIYGSLMLLALTYISLLLAAKRLVKASMFPHIHTFLTAFLILFTCIAFGACYTWHFFPDCDFVWYLVKVYKWRMYPTQMWHFAVVGFKEFFVSVENMSITDVHIIQKLVGCILTLVVIPLNISSYGKANGFRPRKGG